MHDTLECVDDIRAVGQAARAVRFDMAAVLVQGRIVIHELRLGTVHIEGAFDVIFPEGGARTVVVGEIAHENELSG